MPAAYSDATQEILAARASAVLFDISAERRMRIYGTGATDLAAAAFGDDAVHLVPGGSCAAHWGNANGGLRGVGTLARMSETNFLL